MHQIAIPPPDPAEVEADRAAARGDVAEARRLLERATAVVPGRVDSWMKLAAMCRAAGDPRAALAAVRGALGIDPLAFVPLLMKAQLLDARADATAVADHVRRRPCA